PEVEGRRLLWRRGLGDVGAHRPIVPVHPPGGRGAEGGEGAVGVGPPLLVAGDRRFGGGAAWGLPTVGGRFAVEGGVAGRRGGRVARGGGGRGRRWGRGSLPGAEVDGGAGGPVVVLELRGGWERRPRGPLVVGA